MGHCSRDFNGRPDFRAPSRGTPDVGWTVIDPYRASHYSNRYPAGDEPYRPPAPRGSGRRSPGLPIAPVIVLFIVMVSSFPAGLMLMPLLVVGLVMLSLSAQGNRRRRWEQRGVRQQPPTWSPPETWSPPATRSAPPAANPVPDSAPTGDSIVQPVEANWPSRNPAVRSPFEMPAFWDAEPERDRTARPAPLTPPAWDPLGVAPFAWDLPDPPALTPRRTRRLGSTAGPLLAVAVVLAAMLATAGDFAGWWPLDWAAAGAGALAVAALAMFGAALRQRIRR